MEKVLLVGGDKRRVSLAEYLEEKGFTVIKVLPEENANYFFKEKQEEVRIVVLPLPAVDDEYIFAPLSDKKLKVDELLASLEPGTLVLGGKLSKSFTDMLDKRKLQYVDYYNREELSVYNAVPTVEGAMRIAMQELPVTIYNLNTLIIGFGRVGKMCADRFSAMGAKVTVAARSEKDRAWADSLKMNAVEVKDLDCLVENYDLIINTVPALIVNKKVLEQTKRDCLIIDLASKPGGVDFAAAAEMGIKTIWALSLPGKEAPATAGRILGSAIYNIIRETGR